MDRVVVSVRTIAEFSMESGDLYPNMDAYERMQDGAQAHKRLQMAYGEGAKAEVAVALDAEVEGVPMRVQGRIDGLLQGENGAYTVQEIKSTRHNPRYIRENDNPVHWAQAEIYAYLFARLNNLARISVMLTYVNSADGEASFTREHTQGELEEIFLFHAGKYARWLRAIGDWRENCRESARAVQFPHANYRKGQRKMAKNAYIAIRDQKLLLCQAPTGTGKTLGALFPAVKAISEGLIARAFYLTARTTARRAAEDALRLLRQNGLKLRAVTLTAKDKICFSPRTSCHPSECVFAQDYFDKRREALREALNLQALDRAAIEALAREYDVCPFELSLDLTETAEIIICDYNYVFDPHVRLKRFFGDKAIKGDYALMIDEAHNLFPRAQDMLSAQLSERSLRLVRRALKEWVGKENEVYKALSDVIRVMCRLNRELDAPECQLAPYGALHDAVAKFVAAGEGHISENEMLAEALFAAMDYLRVEQEFDDERMRVLYVTGKHLTVKLWRYLPTDEISAVLHRARGGVLFSATLSPMEHYAQLLGLNERGGDALVDLPSPFPPENFLPIALNLPTRYSARGETAARVAQAIYQMARAHTGNYIACFPSYAYLEMVREIFAATYPQVRVIVQRGEMAEEERDAFLAQFSCAPRASMVAFIVMGGVFAEGVDLPGERLSGAAIVGVGMPQLSFERDTFASLVEDGEGSGFEMAYVYPGIVRVLQAAGRVIRSETDRGVALLIDERFCEERFARLLPRHYRVRRADSLSQVDALLSAFWAQSAQQPPQEERGQ